MIDILFNVLTTLVGFIIGGSLFSSQTDKFKHLLERQNTVISHQTDYIMKLYKENQRLHEVIRYGGKTREEAIKGGFVSERA